MDNKELDYQDDDGNWWVMAACGHHVGGTVKLGDKIALCPNCRFLGGFHNIKIIYTERLPDEFITDAG